MFYELIKDKLESQSTRRKKHWLKLFTAISVTFGLSQHGHASSDEALGLEADLPVVLTPTRLRQSIDDAPASVTVITSAMLREFGIRSVIDALRLVPGMAVTEVMGTDTRVN